MQMRTVRGVVRSLVVALTAGVLVVGCSDDDNGPSETRNVNVTIPLKSNTSEIVEGSTFNGVSGTVLSQNIVPASTGLAGKTVSIQFHNISGASGQFTMTTTSPAMTATGTVAFASCTFTVQTTTNASVLAVGSVITISNCSVTVNATGVEVGGDDETGSVILNLNGSPSTGNPTSVEIRSDGVLIVENGDGQAVVTGVVITGSSGG